MRIPLSWLNEYLPTPLTTEQLIPLLTMGIAEVESVESVDGEEVLQLELKPDRGDCLSVEGLAREASALSGVLFQEAPGREEVLVVSEPGKREESAGFRVPIRLEAPDLCPRYAGAVMEGVRVEGSPDWLQRRIRQLGLRPVNNIVDATNLVMMETGQPLHAFDLDRLNGPAIVVRRARPGEELVAINGESYVLSEKNLVIADADHAVAIAGVMGGQDSEVSASTNRLLLESAHFDPVSVRLTSRALALRSDASYRFERTVDPGGCVRSLQRVIGLIREVAGGSVIPPLADVYPNPVEKREILLDLTRVSRILGMPVSEETICSSLQRLGLKVGHQEELLIVEIPSRRPDLEIPEDLVEEVARMVGYDQIPATLPVGSTTPGLMSEERQVVETARDALVGCGYTELRSYSLTSPAALERAGDAGPTAPLRNPTSTDRTVLRPAILPSLLEAAENNLAFGFRSQHLFEIGRVFHPVNEQRAPLEQTHLAGFAMGTAWDSTWNLAESLVHSDFFAVRGVLDDLAAALRIQFVVEAGEYTFLHPGRSAVVSLAGGGEIGFLGELHPTLCQRFGFGERPIVFELAAAPLVEAHYLNARRPIDMEIHRLPPATRDLAVVVPDSVPAAQVLAVVRGASPLVSDVQLFDVYRGQGIGTGHHSLAMAIILRRPGHTLTDVEANAAMEEIVAVLSRLFGARRR